jgi:thioredoxin-related protein
MKALQTILLVLFLISTSYSAQGVINIDQIAHQEAKIEKKHILVFFHMTYCPYCKKMIHNAFSDDIVKKKMEKNYIFIDVNIDDEGILKYKDFSGTKKEFSKYLAIGYYPSVLFIDENDKIVYAMKGYRKTETFKYILDYVTNKAYLQTDFAGYLFDNDLTE